MANVIDLETERAYRNRPDGSVPPHDIDAEAAVISATLLDASALQRIQAIGFQPEHMFSESHRWIMTAAYECAREGVGVDAVNVGTWLKNRERISQVGGMSYITELLNAAPATARVAEYAATVYEKWRVRQIIGTAQRIAAEGYFDIGDVQSWADGSARSLGVLAQKSIGAKCETNIETLKRLMTSLRERAASESGPQKKKGIRTGFPTLDKMLLGGLHSGWKFTVCSLSNVGKSAFGIQVAVAVARQGIGVQCFITEASRDEWFTRAQCQMARIDARKLGDDHTPPRLSPAEWSRLTEATIELSKLPIWIDAETDIHIGQVKQRTLARLDQCVNVDRVPLGLVVLDHVHRLAPAPEVQHKDLRLQLKHATETFKALLKQLQIAGLELAQMKDNPIDGRTKARARPGRGFVAECRYIEREADAIIYLHQKPLVNTAGKVVGEDRRNVLGILDKVRSVDNDDIEFAYIVEESRFVDERGQTDDRVDPMIPVSRVYIAPTPDPRLPPERDDEPQPEFFNTEDM